MTKSLIAIGVAGALVTTVMIVWRRLREDALVRRVADKYKLTRLERGRTRMRRELSESVLAQIGHSRRFRFVYEAPNGVRIASYVFETGTESNRAMHSWRVAVIDVDKLSRFGLLTCEAVFISAGKIRRLAPKGTLLVDGDPPPHSEHVFLIDDDDYWRAALTPELRQFFTQQSRERTWEFLPGRLIAYESGAFTESEIVAIADQVARCAHLLEESTVTGGTESFDGVLAPSLVAG